jgi:hypothetical protein
MDQQMYAYLEIQGDRDSCLGFIEGFRLALKEKDVFFSDEIGFELPTFLDNVVSGLHRETHLVAPLSFLEAMIDAMQRTQRIKLKAEKIRPLSGASFSFAYKCYSAEEGHAIRELIEHELPEGLSLEDYEVKEEIDPDAKGAELYSPVHDYILKGKGLYRGPFEAVKTMALRLRDQSFIHPDKIELEYPS